MSTAVWADETIGATDKGWADAGGFREIDPLLYSGNVIQIKLKMIYSRCRHRLASVFKRLIHKTQHR